MPDKLPVFIDNLRKENKLNFSIDKSLKIDWPWTKIAGPALLKEVLR